jgi:hypothetical protein
MLSTGLLQRHIGQRRFGAASLQSERGSYQKYKGEKSRQHDGNFPKNL